MDCVFRLFIFILTLRDSKYIQGSKAIVKHGKACTFDLHRTHPYLIPHNHLMPAEFSPPKGKKRKKVHLPNSTLKLPSSTISKMKRKTGRELQGANGQPDSKKRALSHEEAATRFREGLFDSAELQKYTTAYAESKPYALISVHTGLVVAND